MQLVGFRSQADSQSAGFYNWLSVWLWVSPPSPSLDHSSKTMVRKIFSLPPGMDQQGNWEMTKLLSNKRWSVKVEAMSAHSSSLWYLDQL
jgi:hypothetical protein